MSRKKQLIYCELSIIMLPLCQLAGDNEMSLFPQVYFVKESVFELYPIKKIRQIFSQRKKQSIETLMLVEYPLPGKGYRDISIKAWEWIVCLGVVFGDTS